MSFSEKSKSFSTHSRNALALLTKPEMISMIPLSSTRFQALVNTLMLHQSSIVGPMHVTLGLFLSLGALSKVHITKLNSSIG